MTEECFEEVAYLGREGGSMSDETELLPCPFCGGKAETYDAVDVEPWVDGSGAYVGADFSYVERTGCPKCDIWFWIGEDDLEGATVERWNRRGA